MHLRATRSHPQDQSSEEAGGGDLQWEMQWPRERQGSRGNGGRGQIKGDVEGEEKTSFNKPQGVEGGPKPSPSLGSRFASWKAPPALTPLPASMWPVNVFSHRCWLSPPSQEESWQNFRASEPQVPQRGEGWLSWPCHVQASGRQPGATLACLGPPSQRDQ